jgi:antibiotic biosynthesis monooxygenase (ABM) superfamily enzyme
MTDPISSSPAPPSSPVTTLFARKVRRGSEPQYERWLVGIADAAAHFEGYGGTTTFKPNAEQDQYLAMITFDAAAHLDRWLDSPQHRLWVDALRAIPVEHEQVTSLQGLQRWFSLPRRPEPADYKIAALIVIGLYPLVLLLDLALAPLLRQLPQALSTLIGLLISVPVMVWIVLPLLTRLFSRWLYPAARASAGPRPPS